MEDVEGVQVNIYCDVLFGNRGGFITKVNTLYRSLVEEHWGSYCELDPYNKRGQVKQDFAADNIIAPILQAGGSFYHWGINTAPTKLDIENEEDAIVIAKRVKQALRDRKKDQEKKDKKAVDRMEKAAEQARKALLRTYKTVAASVASVDATATATGVNDDSSKKRKVVRSSTAAPSKKKPKSKSKSKTKSKTKTKKRNTVQSSAVAPSKKKSKTKSAYRLKTEALLTQSPVSIGSVVTAVSPTASSSWTNAPAPTEWMLRLADHSLPEAFSSYLTYQAMTTWRQEESPTLVQSPQVVTDSPMQATLNSSVVVPAQDSSNKVDVDAKGSHLLPMETPVTPSDDSAATTVPDEKSLVAELISHRGCIDFDDPTMDLDENLLPRSIHYCYPGDDPSTELEEEIYSASYASNKMNRQLELAAACPQLLRSLTQGVGDDAAVVSDMDMEDLTIVPNCDDLEPLALNASSIYGEDSLHSSSTEAPISGYNWMQKAPACYHITDISSDEDDYSDTTI